MIESVIEMTWIFIVLSLLGVSVWELIKLFE